MKKYLEVIEQVEDLAQQPQMFRIEVADVEDAKKQYEKIKNLFENINHIKQIHNCKHDDNEACELEFLEI
jgi:hypothetical protein